MELSAPRFLPLVSALSAALLLSTPSPAVEGDRVCFTSNPSWTLPLRLPLGAGGIPTSFTWWIVTGNDPTSAAGPLHAPGFPVRACSPTTVEQSLGAAASTWNNAQLFNNAPAVTLQLPTTFTGLSTAPIPVQDATNSVSLWAPASHWATLGGSFTQGQARIWSTTSCPGVIILQPCLQPSVIVECDIALNARSVNAAGIPAWSFVETVAGDTFATWPDSGTARTDPTLGYVDLQGALTHEVGHALGLGHSMVDSSVIAGASLLPTMFERSAAEAFTQTSIKVPNGACASDVWPEVKSGALASIYARGSRTLEQDDISAVHGYGQGTPLPFNGSGGIRGWIRHAPSSSSLPTAGASVVAVSVTDPNRIRAGTFSYFFLTGEFEISGLPPGDYFLSVEPAGNVAAGFPVGPELLRDVPNYVQVEGCAPQFASPWRDLTAELFNGAAESFAEYAPTTSTARVSQRATRVTVTANAFTPTLNLFVETVAPGTPKNLLAVGYGNGPTSIRGVVVPSLAGLGASPQLVFQVPGLDGVAGDLAVLFLDLQRSTIENPLNDSQLFQVAPALSYPGIPVLGVATIVVPLQPTFFRTTLFGQAAILRANGSIEFTNVVSAFVVDR